MSRRSGPFIVRTPFPLDSTVAPPARPSLSKVNPSPSSCSEPNGHSSPSTNQPGSHPHFPKPSAVTSSQFHLPTAPQPRPPRRQKDTHRNARSPRARHFFAPPALPSRSPCAELNPAAGRGTERQRRHGTVDLRRTRGCWGSEGWGAGRRRGAA